MRATAAKHRLARTSRHGLAVGCAAMTLSACQFGGLNSLNLPGTEGHGKGSFTISAELPDVGTLPQNSPVLVDDVTVGSVSGMRAMQRNDGTFYAEVQIVLNAGVKLPANATATIGQTSLLGSQHLELAAPTDQPPTGTLQPGAHIPIGRAGRYPTTEEVLSSLGVITNKGNLGALQDITDELHSAVAGHAGQFADCLPRVAELTASVDRQTGDLITAVEKLTRFAGRVTHGNDKLARALDTSPAALRVLDDNGGHIVEGFTALKQFAEIAARILSHSKADFAADLKDAYSVLKPLADNANALVGALPVLATFPIPQAGIKQIVRGDYLNVFITLDLTTRRFGENLFTTSGLDPNMRHLDEVIDPPDFLMGQMANLSGQAADPFNIPPPRAETPPAAGGR